jgi:hypothetical protein
MRKKNIRNTFALSGDLGVVSPSSALELVCALYFTRSGKLSAILHNNLFVMVKNYDCQFGKTVLDSPVSVETQWNLRMAGEPLPVELNNRP